MVVNVIAATNPCGRRLAAAVRQYLSWMVQNDYKAETIYHYDRLLKHFQNFIHKGKLNWEAVFDYETLQVFQKNCKLHGAANAVRGLGRYLCEHQIVACAFVKPYQPLPDIYEDFFIFNEQCGSFPPGGYKFVRNLLEALTGYLAKSGIAVEHLRIEHVDGFIAEYSAGYGQTSRRHIRTYLRKFLRYLYFERKIIHRDLASLVVGAVDFARIKPPKFLTPQQVQQLFINLGSRCDKDLRQAAMVHLGYWLGLRPKEISQIRLDDIAFAKFQICIADRKSANPIKLPLPENAIKAIAAYVIGQRPKSDHRRLFLTLHPPYRPVSAATVGHDITKILKKIHPAATAYWLRHTYAQNLLESGASIFELKEMMGHGNIQSARRYLHIHTELMRKVLLDEVL